MHVFCRASIPFLPHKLINNCSILYSSISNMSIKIKASLCSQGENVYTHHSHLMLNTHFSTYFCNQNIFFSKCRSVRNDLQFPCLAMQTNNTSHRYFSLLQTFRVKHCSSLEHCGLITSRNCQNEHGVYLSGHTKNKQN